MSKLIKNYKRRIAALRNFANLTAKQKANLLAQLQRNNLLTPDHANAKTAKNTGLGVASYILHLAPANASGYNTCPKASEGCKLACLNTAGRGRFEAIQLARVQKTLYFFKFRTEFLAQLHAEITALEKRAVRDGLKPVVRLNGTSDLPWESFKIGEKSLFELHKNVQFYDYTKILSRLERFSAAPIANYHLTFSASESNFAEQQKALQLGFNVAVVFSTIPERYLGAPIVNGDLHDLRFLDPNGAIVALKAKGKAKKDISGFVVHLTALQKVG